jgi:hypothetical protein
MQTESGYSSEKTSEFNSMVAKMYRISECWINVNDHKRKGALNKWKSELDIVSDELLPDARVLLSQKDYTRHVSQDLKLINKKIIDATKEQNRSKISHWLRQKERMLRYIDNLTGRGLKIKKIKDIKRAITLG